MKIRKPLITLFAALLFTPVIATVGAEPISESQFESMLPEDVTMPLFISELQCLPPYMEDGALDDWHFDLLIVNLMANLHTRDQIVSGDYPLDYLNRLISPVTSRRLSPETDPTWTNDDGTVYYAWNPVTGIANAKITMQEITESADGVLLHYLYQSLDEVEQVTGEYMLEAEMKRDSQDGHLTLTSVRDAQTADSNAADGELPPDVPEVYQEILDQVENYYQASIEKSQELLNMEYPDVSYEYALADITGDGFPELLTGASKGIAYSSDPNAPLLYDMADIRVFSWSENENRMYIPEGYYLFVGASSAGGVRGKLFVSSGGDSLLYTSWGSGIGSGRFDVLTLNKETNTLDAEVSIQYEAGMTDQNQIPFEYSSEVVELSWQPVPGHCQRAILSEGFS